VVLDQLAGCSSFEPITTAAVRQGLSGAPGTLQALWRASLFDNCERNTDTNAGAHSTAIRTAHTRIASIRASRIWVPAGLQGLMLVPMSRELHVLLAWMHAWPQDH
jgi:hypothetical protein